MLIDSSWCWVDLSHPHRDDRHHTAAVRSEDGWIGLWLPGVRQHDAQQQLHHQQHPLAVKVYRALVTGAPEVLASTCSSIHRNTAGTPQEHRPGQPLDPFGTSVVADAKGDQGIVIAEDALLGSHPR